MSFDTKFWGDLEIISKHAVDPDQLLSGRYTIRALLELKAEVEALKRSTAAYATYLRIKED
jgi:hypothetical protein